MPAFKQTNPNNGQPNIFLNRYYPLLGLGIFTLILILAYFFFIAGKITEVKQQKNSRLPIVQQESAALKAYFKKSDELNTFVKNYNTLHQAELNKAGYALPASAKIPELMAQLPAITAQDGFQISQLNIVSAEPKNTSRSDETAAPAENSIKQLSVSLGVTGGDYFSFKKLLNDIENHLRLLDVISIEFQSTQGSMGYTLNMQTYYLP